MPKLPATYLDLRAEFVRRRVSFRQVAEAVNRDHGQQTSEQYVRNALRMYWGRKDMPVTGEIAHFVLDKARELVTSPTNGHKSPPPLKQSRSEDEAAEPATA